TAVTQGNTTTLSLDDPFVATQAELDAEIAGRKTGDTDTLAAAKDYATTADATVLAAANNYATTADATILAQAKDYAATADVTNLVAAKDYTDQSVAAEAGFRASGDATTLASANAYTDTKTSGFVGNVTGSFGITVSGQNPDVTVAVDKTASYTDTNAWTN